MDEVEQDTRGFLPILGVAEVSHQMSSKIYYRTDLRSLRKTTFSLELYDIFILWYRKE